MSHRPHGIKHPPAEKLVRKDDHKKAEEAPKKEPPKTLEQVTAELKPKEPAKMEGPRTVQASPAQILEMISHMDESNWRQIKDSIQKALTG